MTLYAERKAEHVALARKHFAADMLKKGTYGEGEGTEFRGCSVGCLWNDVGPGPTANKHAGLAKYFLYPEWMLRLQDTVFEGLPSPDHLRWHVTIAETLEKLPEDYDWQAAFHRIISGILRIAMPHAGRSTDAVQRVIDLYDRAARGEVVTRDEWQATAAAADRAAAAADASYAVVDAAAYAVYIAAAAAAESAARAVATYDADAAVRWAAAAAAAAAARWAVAAAGDAAAAAYLQIRDAILAALNVQKVKP